MDFSIGTFLTELATGLTAWVPAFAKAIYDAFIALFFLTGEAGAITGFNPLGIIALGLMVIGFVWKIIPTALGFLRMQMKRAKARRASRKRG